MFVEKRLTWAEIHLDALRGLAALVVALGHARGLFFSSLTGAVPASKDAINATAAIGPQTSIAIQQHVTVAHGAVLVFFVLSGYLVGGSVLKSISSGAWSWRTYLIKRLVRLWLVLIPAVIIGLCIDAIGYHFFGQPGTLYSGPPGQDYVRVEYFTEDPVVFLKVMLGNILFVQGMYSPVAGTNLALWSLANEFWYYLLFPMILLAARASTPMTGRLLYGLGAIGITLMLGAWGSFLFLIWVLGAVASLLPKRIPPSFAPWAVLITAGALACSLVAVKKLGITFHASEMLIGLVSALMVYVIKCQDRAGRQSVYSGTSHFLSNISYTLYLTHLPFLIFVVNLINSPWSLSPLTPTAFAKFSTVIAATILWAYGLYLLFESRTDSVRALVVSMIARISGGRDAKQMT